MPDTPVACIFMEAQPVKNYKSHKAIEIFILSSHCIYCNYSFEWQGICPHSYDSIARIDHLVKYEAAAVFDQ